MTLLGQKKNTRCNAKVNILVKHGVMVKRVPVRCHLASGHDFNHETRLPNGELWQFSEGHMGSLS